jgi:hypothetical protein
MTGTILRRTIAASLAVVALLVGALATSQPASASRSIAAVPASRSIAAAPATAASTSLLFVFDKTCSGTDSNGFNVPSAVRLTGQFNLDSTQNYANLTNAVIHTLAYNLQFDVNRWYEADYSRWQSGYSGGQIPYVNGPVWNTTMWMGWSPSLLRYGQWEFNGHGIRNGVAFKVRCTVYANNP